MQLVEKLIVWGFLPIVEEYDTGLVAQSIDAKDKLATNWGKIKKQ